MSRPATLPDAWAIDQAGFLESLPALQAQHLGEAQVGHEDAPPPPYTVRQGVAVHDVSGVLMESTGFWAMLFGGTSYRDIRAAIAQAEGDPEVVSHLFVIDSPGGAVAGCSQTAHLIRGCSKPTTAWISGKGTSAAYWLAAACQRVYAAPTAIVGCIGTQLIMPAGGEAGAVVFTGAATPRKMAAAESDDGRAQYQAAADAQTLAFLGDLATFRGLPDALAVAEAYGRGAILVGPAALQAGIVDALMIDPPFTPVAAEAATPDTGGQPMPGTREGARAEGAPVDQWSTEELQAELDRRKAAQADPEEVEPEAEADVPAEAEAEPDTDTALWREVKRLKAEAAQRARRDREAQASAAFGELVKRGAATPGERALFDVAYAAGGEALAAFTKRPDHSAYRPGVIGDAAPAGGSAKVPPSDRAGFGRFVAANMKPGETGAQALVRIRREFPEQSKAAFGGSGFVADPEEYVR